MRTFKLKYSDFGFQTSAGLSTVQVTCPLKLFFSGDAVFSKFLSPIQTISVLNEAIRSFQNYCGKFVKDSFHVSKRTLRGYFVIMKYLLPFLNDFGTWQSKLRTLAILAEKIWAGSSKLFSASPEEDFEDNLFFLPFTVFFSFSKFEQLKLWNHQKFPTCRQYCIPCVTWIILNDNNFFWNSKFSSTSLELWVEKSSEFSNLFSAALPKLQFSCPENTPRKNIKSNSAEVGTLLTFFLKFEQKKKLTAAKDKTTGVSKLHCSVQRNIWTKTVFLKLL